MPYLLIADTLSEMLGHPLEAFESAILANAHSFILVHNHSPAIGRPGTHEGRYNTHRRNETERKNTENPIKR